MAANSFLLRPAPPFRLDLTVWALRRRPHNAIDLWDGAEYSRLLLVGTTPVFVTVVQTAPPERPELRVVYTPGLARVDRTRVAAAVERVLGLNTDLHHFYSMAGREPHLALLVRRFTGFRPPRFPTVFEAVVNAVCCQQLSLDVGILLLNRLAARAGRSFSKNGRQLLAFPRPRDVTRLSPGILRGLGFSQQKAVILVDLAHLLLVDQNYLESLAALDDETARTRLLELNGIGRWSAEYVLLRGLGRLSVFPADDVAAQKNLRHWLRIGEKQKRFGYKEIHAALRVWHPYQGLVYFHLRLQV